MRAQSPPLQGGTASATVEGAGAEMATAEEAMTAVVEQADDGQGGGGAVYALFYYSRSVEKAYTYFLSPAVPEWAQNKLDSVKDAAFCVLCYSTGL